MELREHLVPELDYMMLHAKAWDALVLWYGILPGQVSNFLYLYLHSREA